MLLRSIENWVLREIGYSGAKLGLKGYMLFSDVSHILHVAVVYSDTVMFQYFWASLTSQWTHAHRQFRRFLEGRQVCFCCGTTPQVCCTFGVICSTSVFPSTVVESSQLMWQFLVNSSRVSPSLEQTTKVASRWWCHEGSGTSTSCGGNINVQSRPSDCLAVSGFSGYGNRSGTMRVSGRRGFLKTSSTRVSALVCPFGSRKVYSQE